MWKTLLSGPGLAGILAVALLLGAQSLRLRHAQSSLLAERAMVVSLRADNARLTGELQKGIEDITAQNKAIQTLRINADVVQTNADDAARRALVAGHKARDVRRPSDAASLNARLQELFQ